jgi:hypothetical protein
VDSLMACLRFNGLRLAASVELTAGSSIPRLHYPNDPAVIESEMSRPIL